MTVAKLRMRALIGFCVIMVMAAVLGIAALMEFVKMGDALQLSYAWPDKIIEIHEVQSDLEGAVLADMFYAFAQSAQERDTLSKIRRDLGAKAISVLDSYRREIATDMTYKSETDRQNDAKDIMDLANAWEAYSSQSNRFISAWERGDVGAASDVVSSQLEGSLEKIMTSVASILRKYAQRAIVTDRTGNEQYVAAVRFFAILIVIFIVISIIVIVMFTLSISRGAAKLAAAGGGDLVESSVSVRELVEQIHDSAEMLAHTSEDLEHSADISGRGTHQIDQNIEHVSREAAHQYADLEHAVSELERASQEIAMTGEALEESCESALRAVAKAREGEESMQRVVRQITIIERSSDTSAKVVTSLGERSSEIGQIVATISRIASQTNLLALNAAIEAARAGEQGRGFSVVAEQVKKLAGESQLAAEEISKLIASIQEETDQAIEAMTGGQNEVRAGAQAIEESGRAFSDLASMSVENADKLKTLVGTMRGLVSTAETLLGDLRNVEGESKAISDDSRSIVKATEAQASEMDRISAETHALEKISHDMLSAASRYDRK